MTEHTGSSGQTVVIIGANRGIGLALVEAYLARTSHRLIATYRSAGSAGQLIALAGQHAQRLTLIQMDVTDEAQVRAAAGQSHVPVDLLINNAGILFQETAFTDMTAEHLLQSVDVNAGGALRVTQALLPRLQAADGARVVNISSEAASISTRNKTSVGSYAISKAALNMLTRIMAMQLGEWGIVTIAVHPGNIRTDMGPENPTAPEDCARHLLALFGGITAADNGRYLLWDGTDIPW
jgi:NAD(P)-dependent dehydrogenase (short-subunit alcohol dehydrogenase family)